MILVELSQALMSARMPMIKFMETASATRCSLQRSTATTTSAQIANTTTTVMAHAASAVAWTISQRQSQRHHWNAKTAINLTAMDSVQTHCGSEMDFAMIRTKGTISTVLS